MLGPMAELAPGLRHPVLGLTMGELWQRFDRATHPMEEVRLDVAPDGAAP
jgi:2-amino-4-hydroxy-6-hydroxymethyldihydropteridine diphosphokinase